MNDVYNEREIRWLSQLFHNSLEQFNNSEGEIEQIGDYEVRIYGDEAIKVIICSYENEEEVDYVLILLFVSPTTINVYEEVEEYQEVRTIYECFFEIVDRMRYRNFLLLESFTTKREGVEIREFSEFMSTYIFRNL